MELKESLLNIGQNIKSFFSNLYEKISDFFRENTKLAVLISTILICILVLIILVIVLLSNNSRETSYVEPGVVLTEELLVPDGPEIQRNYNISRETKKAWSEEETDPWFTVPGAKDIENLGNANDKIVSEIIEAAP